MPSATGLPHGRQGNIVGLLVLDRGDQVSVPPTPPVAPADHGVASSRTRRRSWLRVQPRRDPTAGRAPERVHRTSALADMTIVSGEQITEDFVTSSSNELTTDDIDDIVSTAETQQVALPGPLRSNEGGNS